MEAGPRNGAVDAAVEMCKMFENHQRSLNEWDRWFADDFVREDRRQLVGMPAADAATFHEQHLAWFEMDDTNVSFDVTEAVAVFGERLALTRTRIGYSSGFFVEMLTVHQWTEGADRVQKIVQFDGSDLDGALDEFNRLRLALEADEVAP